MYRPKSGDASVLQFRHGPTLASENADGCERPASIMPASEAATALETLGLMGEAVVRGEAALLA